MRIFALSDQHGYVDFRLPKADLILHAGDVCRDFAPHTPYGASRQEQWLREIWVPWRGNNKVMATFGNHDFVQKLNAPLGFYVDELKAHHGLTIWFSPWSPEFMGWAWMKPDEDLRRVYDTIPEGTDIIVSHAPPYGYGDCMDAAHGNPGIRHEDPHLGSKTLLTAIDRVRPKVVICGHIHSGHGTYLHVLPCLACQGSGMVLSNPGPNQRAASCIHYGDATTMIYNVSIVDADYKRIHEPTEIIL